MLPLYKSKKTKKKNLTTIAKETVGLWIKP